MEAHERTRKFELKRSEDDEDVAYLELPTFPKGPWKTSKSIRLFDLIGRYAGPDVVLDFDEEGIWVGIEIVG